MKSLPHPLRASFQIVALDLIGPMPGTMKGNKYILSVIDYTTRWPEAIPIPDKSAKTVADAFVKQIICRYGAPKVILTDRGTEFLDQIVEEISRIFGFSHIKTSGYAPQTNGLVERFNSTLIGILENLPQNAKFDWDQYIDFALMAYRTSVQASTHETPYFLLYGRDMTIPMDIEMGLPDERYIDYDDYKNEVHFCLKDAWSVAHANIVKSQIVQKKYYDKKAKEANYEINDLVWVFTPKLAKYKPKLQKPQWNGPYRILDRTDMNAQVKLALHPRAKPKVVHMNRLKPFYEPYTPYPGIEDLERDNKVKPDCDKLVDNE